MTMFCHQTAKKPYVVSYISKVIDYELNRRPRTIFNNKFITFYSEI